MTGPSLATQKSLFVRSSNRCAFPRCPVKMVDGITVIGEICHIKGKKPNAPRYDLNQTPEERHGYENLILLCGNHHTVIDTDEEAYTVERLHKMKRDHEQNATVLPGDFVDTAAALLMQVNAVNSTNQSGGVTAQVVHIYNYPTSTESAPHSPLEIIFDPNNTARKFWSTESLTDEKGESLPFWQYRIEVKNNSSKTVRGVCVSIEHVGQMPNRAVDLVFDKTKKSVCDINPGCSELAVVLNWPIPSNRAGMLSGETALLYGPIVLVASATDTLPTTKVFEFDYQREPVLHEVVATPSANQSVSRSKGVPYPGKIHFVPDRYNHGWARNDSRTDVRAGGIFTYDGEDTLRIVDAFVKGLTPRSTLIQSLDAPGMLIRHFDLRPHNPLRLVFNIMSDPIAAERGKPMRFQIVFRDVYNNTYEVDAVDFPWIGEPVRVAPTTPSRTMWESLSDRFKSVDAKPLPVWAQWIYTIETQHYDWWIKHSSEIAVKMSIELCKEGGKMLRLEPAFPRKFPEVASINDDGDRWLVAIQKVTGLGKGGFRGTSTNQGVVTHSEGGEIKDVPGASQVLCQIAVNGFTD